MIPGKLYQNLHTALTVIKVNKVISKDHYGTYYNVDWYVKDNGTGKYTTIMTDNEYYCPKDDEEKWKEIQ